MSVTGRDGDARNALLICTDTDGQPLLTYTAELKERLAIYAASLNLLSLENAP